MKVYTEAGANNGIFQILPEMKLLKHMLTILPQWDIIIK